MSNEKEAIFHLSQAALRPIILNEAFPFFPILDLGVLPHTSEELRQPLSHFDNFGESAFGRTDGLLPPFLEQREAHLIVTVDRKAPPLLTGIIIYIAKAIPG
jgi:hypothetical protein